MDGVYWNFLAPRTEKTDPGQAMDEITRTTRPVPAGWLEALAESEAELASGLTVPGDEVMRELYESIARLEARRPASRVTRRR